LQATHGTRGDTCESIKNLSSYPNNWRTFSPSVSRGVKRRVKLPKWMKAFRISSFTRTCLIWCGCNLTFLYYHRQMAPTKLLTLYFNRHLLF
jgi:hypothetical protein